ncbi:MAG: prephenate dehydratase [Firmicutes bacterium]|nr:prephenate dehydratase [Bacillota bacterium]
MLVGYLGPRGTFSEEAATRYYRTQDAELRAFSTIYDVLEEVQTGGIDAAVVPIENTIEGPINITLDSLSESADLFVQGEIILSVSQQLLGLEGAVLERIAEVWSIPPAIAQCRRFIRGLHARVSHYDSTAAAAAELKRSGRTDVGAIASVWAARQIGLRILAPHIQDTAENHTRFVIATKGQKTLPGAQKTMLLIAPNEEHVGLLASIVYIFAALNVNLTWIESRPTKTRLGTYQFYLDAEAPLQDDRMDKAVHILRTLGHSVRILGSYGTCVLGEETIKE